MVVKHLEVGASFPTSRSSIAVAELMIWSLRALEEILSQRALEISTLGLKVGMAKLKLDQACVGVAD